jgi:hypothetical protein
MRNKPGKIKALFMGCQLLLATVMVGYAQDITAISNKLKAYTAATLQEKLFVHSDKDFYMTGELVWFKIYVTDALQHRPLQMSKVCYVELLAKDNRPVLQAKIALTDATGNGSFQLPYSVNSGNYLLRAYTSWMKNQGPDYFFEKNITVVNALRQPDWPLPNASAGYDLQFFPEGGNLVNGLISRVGFRLVNASGKGVACNGAIVNNNNDTVARFSTLRFGMGHFDLRVERSQQYKAVVRTAAGEMISQPLPAALPSGAVMRVNVLANKRLAVEVETNSGPGAVSLLAQAQQQVRAAISKPFVNGKVFFELDESQVGKGITQLTVFNADGKPVAERLVFSKPAALTMRLQADAANYGMRKKVNLSLDASTAGVQSEADCSMSVYLLDSLQQAPSQDINTYLGLQSDLKGTVESPGYYFSDAADVAEAADNLMLTQGWRRFNWDQVLNDQQRVPDHLPELEGHFVQGRLVGKINGSGVPGINASLSVPAEHPLFTTATSGSRGELRFNVPNFFGSHEIVLQSADSNYRVDISNPFFERYSSAPFPVLSLPANTTELLEAHSIQSQVASTYYADKQQNFLLPTGMDTLAFYGNPDDRYYLDDYTRFVTMEEVMREIVSNVRVRKNNDHFSYQVWSTDFKDHFQADPLVLLDGVPVTDLDKLIAFDPLKIRRTDVVTHRFVQNNRVHSGIVSYHTYPGDLAGFPLDANALIIDYAGMQLQREFYSPVYETPVQLGSRLPDMRNLLFWSPAIKTLKGSAIRSFYTADIPGTYIAIVQGLSANGLGGTAFTTFTVK